MHCLAVEGLTSSEQGPNPIARLVNETTSEVAWSGVVGGRPVAVAVVLCDVVLPDLSGAEIVGRVPARSPVTRALFKSVRY